MRGSTPCWRAPWLPPKASPAHAGIDPRTLAWWRPCYRFPRACGDRPLQPHDRRVCQNPAHPSIMRFLLRKVSRNTAATLRGHRSRSTLGRPLRSAFQDDAGRVELIPDAVGLGGIARLLRRAASPDALVDFLVAPACGGSWLKMCPAGTVFGISPSIAWTCRGYHEICASINHARAGRLHQSQARSIDRTLRASLVNIPRTPASRQICPRSIQR